jgi:hypothetical protein
MLLLDWVNGGKTESPDKELILEFEEETAPKVVEIPVENNEAEPSHSLNPHPQAPWVEHEQSFAYNVNVSTGGVHKLEDLFRLAQEETIEFKKKLVY